MNEKDAAKTVQTYAAMYVDALKKKGFTDPDKKAKQYSEKLMQMYCSAKFEEHDQYPTMDVKKIYAVIAMCLLLRENGMTNTEIIDFINFVFQKPKRFFYLLEKIVDVLPHAYKIAEKWNVNDHAKRVEDGSIHYESFQVEDGRIEYNITKCMYVEMFAYYGIRELCKIFCITDVQAYANLTRHVHFTRYSDLSDGNCCHDVITRK